jgi:hypothetical protein
MYLLHIGEDMHDTVAMQSVTNKGGLFAGGGPLFITYKFRPKFIMDFGVLLLSVEWRGRS